MASNVLCPTIWNLTVQPISIYRAAIGPIKLDFVCRVNSVLRNSIPMQCLLISDTIVVAKYVFLFHMKNPTALQDDFWNGFINIWIFFFCTMSQVIHILAPGPEAQNFYICVGRYPEIDESLAPKKNYSVLLVLFLSAGVHVIIGSRYLYLKFILNKKDANVQNDKKTSRFYVKNEGLVTFAANGLVIFLLTTCFLVLFKVNKMDYDTLSTQYVWYYALQLYLPSAIEIAAVVHFLRFQMLRTHLKQEALEILQTLHGRRGKFYAVNT